MSGICWSGGHRGFRSSVDRCADCLQGELETCRAALAASEQRVRDLEREVTVLSKSHDAALIIEENDALRAQLQASEQQSLAYEKAYVVLLTCVHGDEATCGCRETARKFAASPGSPQEKGEGQ